jgi:hypothetical protein
MTCGVRPDTRWGRAQGAVDVMWSLVRDADIHKLGQLARPHTRATDRFKVKWPVSPRARTVHMPRR